MPIAPSKIVALFMLILFLTGIGANSFSSNRLAQELEHNAQTRDLLAHGHHSPQPDTQGTTDAEPLSDSEHLLIHFSSLLQLPLVNANLSTIAQSPVRTLPALSRLLTLPLAPVEQPFRPPRAILSI